MSEKAKNIRYVICALLIQVLFDVAGYLNYHEMKKEQYQIEFVMQRGNCKIYRFNDSNRYVYFSECGNNSTRIIDQHHSEEYPRVYPY